jgi:DHA1 family multidrug resistance protein-like MFS transporter
MTAAFSMLSPIMPLFLPALGVSSASAVALWAGILAGTTSLVAAFASPLWGRLADRHGRKLMLLRSSIAVGVFAALMGVATNGMGRIVRICSLSVFADPGGRLAGQPI